MARPSTLALVLLAAAPAAQAQLSAPADPPENPWSRARARLGKVLFWDEQLSSSGTMACGTCHRPEAGFADPRTRSDPEAGRYFGADRTFFTADDVLGSRTAAPLAEDGTHERRPGSGFDVIPTRRNAPSVLNAAYAPVLFGDGRAAGTFLDPETGAVVSSAGAALESQALLPLLSHMEMSRRGRTAGELAAELRGLRPLALASDVPASVAAWIQGRGYPELFDEAFGDPSVRPVHVAQALAAYMRVLVTRHVPLDDYLAGDAAALTDAERRGWELFSGKAGCVACHPAPLLTDHGFHNLGLDPWGDDGGLWEVTHAESDRGRFRTPGLRQVQDTAPYFHDGSAATLLDVVEFYDRGGDHAVPNRAPEMVPLGLDAGEKADLVAFLGRPLADPRVPLALPPFDRPALLSETVGGPRAIGAGTAGEGGSVPRLVHDAPTRTGRSVAVGVTGASGGHLALLFAAHEVVPRGPGGIVPEWGGAGMIAPVRPANLAAIVTLEGQGPGEGHASVLLDLGEVPAPLVGVPLVLQWYVLEDPQARTYAATAGTLSWFVD